LPTMRPGLRLLIVTVALALTPLGKGMAQISPGPLARPHASLEGGLKCLSCHPVGRKESMDVSCLSCHKEIDWLKTSRRGLHAREATGRCAQCHPDHAGVDFQLVGWTADSLTRFDHHRAGYPLEGGHRDVRCQACHRPSNQTGTSAQLAPEGVRPASWTGLDTSCESCHEEVHRERFEGVCQDCHTVDAWSPAPGFDHDATEYPLTGRHRDVACHECHATSPDHVAGTRGALDPAFGALRYAECSSCHRDTHQGRLGSRCSNCHLTTGFANRIAGRFDHARTRYPLEGLHRDVDCIACHGSNNQRRTPEFATCSACHEDAHDKAATVAVRVRDCTECHDVSGFKPSSFSPEEHRETRCLNCHVASHASQLLSQENPEACETCHVVTEWDSTAFSAEQHDRFSLALDGRHGMVTCRACHGPDRPDLPALPAKDSLGTAGVLFKLGTSTCTSCHTDPHDNRLADLCTECHDARAFRPSTMGLATHAQVGFTLRGAHRATPCVACHEALSRPALGPALLLSPTQPERLTFHTERTDCATCHREPHGGQFQTRENGRCDLCHDEDRFIPATRFDHGKDAGFTLEGAHSKTPCRACHSSTTEGDPTRVRYRPTPKTCEGCHEAKPPTLVHGRAA